jgi:hypothetical protein
MIRDSHPIEHKERSVHNQSIARAVAREGHRTQRIDEWQRGVVQRGRVAVASLFLRDFFQRVWEESRSVWWRRVPLSAEGLSREARNDSPPPGTTASPTALTLIGNAFNDEHLLRVKEQDQMDDWQWRHLARRESSDRDSHTSLGKVSHSLLLFLPEEAAR